MGVFLHQLLFGIGRRTSKSPSPLSSSPFHHRFSMFSTSNHSNNENENPPEISGNPATNLEKLRTHPNPRTRTPLEKQFETWVQKLKPGFKPEDVDDVLRSQSDPDLAYDIFRWTQQQRNYRHTDLTYQTMVQILAFGRRFGKMEALVDEVLAGTCTGSLSLYNTIIHHCCKRNHLHKAIDVFNRMHKFPDCKPTLETYRMLLNAVLRKFSRLNICYVYLHTVRSLLKRMNASGVVPDIFTLNLIIKAYCKCLEMDEALRIFREMGLYKCQPDAYTYGYITKGLCEKGRIDQAMSFYSEMRSNGFVPSSSVYMVLICSLSLGRRFEEAIEIMFHMLDNSMVPDHLTYKTLLEGLCREGRERDAFGLLEELREKEGSIDEKIHDSLLNGLHLICRE